MGGNSSSTPQGNGSQLSQMFMQNQTPSGSVGGYQQPNQVAPISAPQMPGQMQPTPQQAAAATQARMLGRSPMAAPSTAPQQGSIFGIPTDERHRIEGRRGNGSSR